MEAVIFSDGASRGNPGPGGWGAIVSYGDRVKELGGHSPLTTNNRMELTAALNGLIQAKKLAADSVDIVTDSSYLKKGAENWLVLWKRNGWMTKAKKPVLNEDLWRNIDEAVSIFQSVRWELVAGHAGHPANERCDAIATAFADGLKPPLYDGSKDGYGTDLGLGGGLPRVYRGGGRASRPPQKRPSAAFSYISSVDGIVKTHSTWNECEKRVRGISGARFRKTASAEEEKELIIKWS